MHKVSVSIPNKVPYSVNAVQVVKKHFSDSKVTLTEKTLIFIQISEFFSGGFTAAKIRRRIRLAEFFRLIFGGQKFGS